jgi:hypothetical protein
VSTFDAADRAIIAEAAVSAEGGYQRITEAFTDRGMLTLAAACREADAILAQVESGAPVYMPDGTFLQRDAPDGPTGNDFTDLDLERGLEAGGDLVAPLDAARVHFDAEGWDLIRAAAAGETGGVARLIAAFEPYGVDVLTAATMEVDKMVALQYPGYTGVVENGTLVLAEVE